MSVGQADLNVQARKVQNESRVPQVIGQKIDATGCGEVAIHLT